MGSSLITSLSKLIAKKYQGMLHILDSKKQDLTKLFLFIFTYFNPNMGILNWSKDVKGNTRKFLDISRFFLVKMDKWHEIFLRCVKSNFIVHIT